MNRGCGDQCQLGAEVVEIDIAWVSGSGVPQWPVLSP
jgi:hypothetical protein